MLSDSRIFYFIIFAASGVAGLIYEFLWTHYLKLFLGHAAYAQTLVLAVFMGGMALGSWISARLSRSWKNPLLAYAAVESIIGIAAILFHPAYKQFLDIAYNHAIPALGSPMAVAAFKWISAGILILPQSILLGMTFPLMTSGVVRKFQYQTGSTIAMLYFTNSLGAAAGVLASGFLFVAWWGLPGTLTVAGLINLIIAFVIGSIARGNPAAALAPESPNRLSVSDNDSNRLLLAVALLTGTSSFIYEIVWIRMLNLVLGSSTHAFELMLSAFITGLAFGGLWLRKKIDSLKDPIRYLAIVQVVMGLLSLLTLPIYLGSFDVMAWLIKHLPITPGGYVYFNLLSHGIALSIMLPATFCAGMTLPLITSILIKEGLGERSIGLVYSFNTIGCILGVFFAVHVGLPYLGMKSTLFSGAVIDIVLGVWLAFRVAPSQRLGLVMSAVTSSVIIVLIFTVQFDQRKMSSAVYRGEALLGASDTVEFYRDGKTATVSVTRNNDNLSIRTNGKPDASMSMTLEKRTSDEVNQVLLAALPLTMHRGAKTAANIGWGSGSTTHMLLSVPSIERVDSIEIEPAMITGAAMFRPRVERAYSDPRSRIYIEDAKTFFSLYGGKYDIIVSEPSNPWVSGIASLFSEEYYGRIKQHLTADGLFVQWLQMYEINMPLVASVFKALSSQFGDYTVYASNNFDMIIIAGMHAIERPDWKVLDGTPLASELRSVGINNYDDVRIRWIGNKRTLQPLFDSYDVPSNSDYYPLLDLYAAQARYMRSDPMPSLIMGLNLLPINPMLSGVSEDTISGTITQNGFNTATYRQLAATLREYLLHDTWRWDNKATLSDTVRPQADMLRRLLRDCSGRSGKANDWGDGMYYSMISQIIPYSSASELQPLWHKFESNACSSRLSQEQRYFISLLRRIGERDAIGMSTSSRKVLDTMSGSIPSPILCYIVSAGILGDLAQGKTDDARALWLRYRAHIDKKDAQSIMTRALIARL